jgi:hypothetical protein
MVEYCFFDKSVLKISKYIDTKSIKSSIYKSVKEVPRIRGKRKTEDFKEKQQKETQAK